MATRPPRPASTLPADLTSFIGRRHDLVAVRQLFSVSRLVTLTGIGGVGKTRLALQAAHTMQRAFPDGVYVVELGSLSDPDLLAQTVSDALGIRGKATTDPVTVVAEYLRERQLLLVLDNCEHLVEAVAALVDQLLRAAPEVRVLATSRQAMRIAGEHIYPVPPLLAPDPDGLLEPGTTSHYPAVALFADRVAAVVPDFAVTAENEAAVARLCHRLEGIPLAIELAAVRLRVLAVDELADRLDDRFQLLRVGNRNLPKRHQTLQALIDWSYDLCTPRERQLWARSSVFAGGFFADALEAVCSDDEELPSTEVLDTLAGLVEKSIVIREQPGKHARFRMLETFREYGQARLAESGGEPELARRHRDWFARLVETATEEWVGPRQAEWAGRLHLDHANLRVALEFCMSHPGEAGVGLMIAAQPFFWGAMDHLNEAALWLDRGLALEPGPSHARAWGLATRAWIAAFQGDERSLSTMPEQAYEMALDLDDLSALALANHVMGFRQSLSRGPDLAKAIPLFITALEQYAEAGVAMQYQDSARVELAVAYIMLHEFDQAAELAEELRARSTAVGERSNLSYALWMRGMLALLHGDPTTAEPDLVEAVRVKRFLRDVLGLALTLEVLAWAAAATGDAERAATILGGTDKVWQTLGTRHLQVQRARYETMGRASIGDAAYEAAYDRGSELSLDETIAYGLREVAPAEPEEVETANPLTPREQEVAALVAEGMSNKEIAAKLVISLRTAEGHVERILAKQGFKTRAQIASWVTRHRT